jgi:squalene-hopene/tetraprenyl-beta-curcumene cyclase
LPFDRSCNDITAHYLRALGTTGQTDARAERFLRSQQQRDGSWLPLWFGNQHRPDEANPTYGTSRVVLATGDEAGAAWLVANQNEDGGWGGGASTPSSIEETALAVEALASVAGHVAQAPAAIARGVAHLIALTEGGTVFDPAPIGFYFAKLWYYERLYPVIFTVAALERVARAGLIRSAPVRDGARVP